MPRKSDAHDWQYAELEGGDYPRPAQRCARCGMVRQKTEGVLPYYYHFRGDFAEWLLQDGEPPCTPERPATPNVGP